jgi:hypothetical protein
MGVLDAHFMGTFEVSAVLAVCAGALSLGCREKRVDLPAQRRPATLWASVRRQPAQHAALDETRQDSIGLAGIERLAERGAPQRWSGGN